MVTAEDDKQPKPPSEGGWSHSSEGYLRQLVAKWREALWTNVEFSFKWKSKVQNTVFKKKGGMNICIYLNMHGTLLEGIIRNFLPLSRKASWLGHQNGRD